jgi:prepilin-type N-terminal cleavage/methylation domain-containing protein
MRHFKEMKPTPPHQTSSRSGFTILEVLVASAIMGIVLFVLVSSANTTLSLWRDSRDKIAVNQEGRTGVGILDWDLKNIFQPANVSFRPNLSSQGNAETPLRFLASFPSDFQKDPNPANADSVGDVCYVEYRFQDYALSRALVDSKRTFDALSNPNPQFPTVNDEDFELVATNLYQFKVWGYQADKTPLTYPNTQEGGPQINADQVLRTIEYRVEAVDPKFFKLFKENQQFGTAMQYRSRKYFESMQTLSPPTSNP